MNDKQHDRDQQVVMTPEALAEAQRTDQEVYENLLEQIAAGELEIQSQDEINESADNNNLGFVVQPKFLGEHKSGIAISIECDACHCDCWITPSTKSSWQSSGAPIICLVCFNMVQIYNQIEKGEVDPNLLVQTGMMCIARQKAENAE